MRSWILQENCFQNFKIYWHISHLRLRNNNETNVRLCVCLCVTCSVKASFLYINFIKTFVSVLLCIIPMDFFFNFLEIKFISLIFDIFLNILTFFQFFFQFQTFFCVFQDLLVLIETIFQMRIFEMQIFPTQAKFHNKKKSPLALYFKTVCCFACILM